MKKLDGRARMSACTAFLMLALCNASAAGVNAFTFTGPEGGSISTIAFKPDEPSVVVIGGPRGAYRSTDGGSSWQLATGTMLNPPVGILFDPTDSNRVVLTNGHLHVSEDAGRTYSVLLGPSTQSYIQKIDFAADGTLYALTLAGDLFSSVAPFTGWTALARPWPSNTYGMALAADKQAPQTVFVAIEGQGIFRSVNGGGTWSAALTSGMSSPSTIRINSITVKPGDSNVVLASTSDGLYRSNNGGNSWTWQGLGIVTWAGFDPHSPGYISVVSTFGTFARTENDGALWSLGANPLVNGVPVAAFDPAIPGRLLAATNNGIIETLDYGATIATRNTGLRGGSPWALTVSDDGAVYLSMSAGLDAVFRRGTSYTPRGTAQLRNYSNGTLNITSLAASATDSNLLYAVNNGGQVMRSDDGGTNWTAPHPAISGGPDYVVGLAVNPANPQVAFLGRSTSGLWRTTNRGATWIPVANSPGYARVIAFDPANDEVMYVAGGTEATGASAIYKSVNGGDTWTEVRAPGNIWFNAFAFDPENSGIVYAVGVGGALKSNDGGTSWTLLDFGSGQGTVINGTGIHVDAAIPSTVVVLGADGGTGFFRTVDGGLTWQQTLIGGPYGVSVPPVIFSGMVVRPQEPNLLILGAQSGGVAEYEIAPDLELSMNGPTAAIALGSVSPMQLTVRNLGVHDASSAEVRITLPAWLTPSTPAGCTYSAPTLTCATSYIRSQQSRVIGFDVTASMTPSTGQVSASVTGHERDPVSSNDSASVSLQSLEIADLVTTFGSSPLIFDNHAAVTLSATVSNTGPNPSTETEVVFELGSRLAAVSLTATQGTCSLTGTTATCALGTVAAGGEGVRIDITATADGIGAVPVTAMAQGAGMDPDSDQGASATLTLRAVSDVGVTIVDSADPVTAGNSWNYTATVTSNGPDPGGATVIVTLAGATPTQAAGPGANCTIAGLIVTCAIPSLANGASAAITIAATSAAAGSATANATVTFDGSDPSTANNAASASTTKVAPPASSGSSGGGNGGGGGLDGLLLLGLLGLAVSRSRRARCLSFRLDLPRLAPTNSPR